MTPHNDRESKNVEQSPPLWDDAVVEEVRVVRRKLWEASDRDVQKYIEQSRQAAERRNAAKPSKGRGA